MNATTLLALSVGLQAAAALAALRLIAITGRRWAWISISMAIALMAVRRGLILYRTLSGDGIPPQDLTAESFAVLISGLMLFGLLMAGPTVRSLRRAVRARAEAMARFTHLSETTREGVVFHEEGRIVQCNSAFARMMGYTRREIVGMEVPEFVAPESRLLVLERLRERFDRPYEHKAIRKDGSVFDVEACGRTTVIEGRITRVTTIRDVTERNRVEQSLRDSERAMATLLANLPGVAYRCVNDRNWTMEFVSQGCRALTGYDVEDIVRNRVMSFGEMQHADDRERIWIEVQRCLDSKTPFQLTYRIITKDGLEKWVWEQGVGIYTDAGELVALEGLITDISDRVRAEQALRTAHDELDERVKERTVDLETAKAKLEREIQERARIAQALMESERKFRMLCTSAPIGIFLTDATGETVYVNPRLLEIAGLTEQEALGWGWLNGIHPDDRPAVVSDARSAAETGAAFDNEFRILRGDGQVRWVHAQDAPITDTAGVHVGKVGSVEDITTRKLAETALKEREAQHDLILRSVPMALYTAQPDEGFSKKWISYQIEQLSGFPVDSFAGSPAFWRDRLHPEDRRHTLEAFDCLPAGETVSVEYRWRAADGSYRWWFDQAVLTMAEDGQPLAVIGTILDVTERKQMELALRESQQRLQGILDNSPAVIYVKDRDGRYQLINDRFEEIFDVTRAAVLGRNDQELFQDDPQTAEAFRQNDLAVLESRRPTEFEEVAPHTDGMHTYISLKFPLFAPGGEPYATCGISTDITDRKRASEAMARAKEEAEAASRAKTVFLANVSHELKTPIMAMMGSAELLRAKQIEDASNYRSDVIIRNARHLLDLVDRILDLARVESDGMEMRMAPCSILDIIEDARAANMPLPSDRDVSFEVLFESKLPGAIRTDATRVRQAVINLVSNALKFTIRGIVRLRVRIEGEGESGTLNVIVEDTGPGIAAESREHIFAPFAQLDPHKGEILQGVGLGLPLARAFARALGGDVVVDSTPGEGSRFTLTVQIDFPDGIDWISKDTANRRLRVPEMENHANPVTKLQGSVLLAEDYRDTRELIEAALEQAGAEVTAVADGAEAVQAASEREYDLILLDVRMPQMDGIQAAGKIRANGIASAIIALTASKGPSEKQRLLEAGFDDLWTKPIQLRTLLEEVSAYLETDPTVLSESHIEQPLRKTTGTSEFEKKIAAANAEYARALPEKVASVQGHVSEGNFTQARELLHQLAGSGGMHGFMTISDEAGKLLRAISKSNGRGPVDLTHLIQDAASIADNHADTAVSDAPAEVETDRK